ncbi:hypothetical protein WDZ17_09210 [Pseudokineococcus basanitobsidens]|uniref:Phospholipase A2-like protein n=1 Tax=Pseudokineococcus basanitobsidens TaxID=1926649 RepID=A0ABU8RKI8_9ACTN
MTARDEDVDDRPTATRRRAWPWVLLTVALVGVLAVVGVGVFALLDGTLGGDTGDEGVYTQDGELVEEPPLAEGQTYGDNADLDALWDACEDGDGAACDELYSTSELGSEYEVFGQYCGGRVPETEDPPFSCTEVTG